MRARSILPYVFTGLLSLITVTVRAQQPGSNTSLSQVLKVLEAQYGTTFSYNSTLLDPLPMDYPQQGLTLQQSLQYVERVAPVRFEKVTENEYLIIPVRSSVAFTAIDSETGQDIPIVLIQVNDQPERYILTQKNKFIIPDLFPTDSLTIASRFYNTVRLTASDLSTQNGELQLVPATLKLDEVSVISYMTQGVNSKLSDHSLEVKMKDLGLLAGETDGDVLLLLKSMPGIRTPSGKPGALTIRGSTFGQNLVYFDDIPIYHQGHFFGTVSPFNPGIIDKITVHRGTLPAQWGGRVGGLIDIRTSEQVPESLEGGISLNTIYAGTQLKVPVVSDKLALSVSARTNYPFETLPPKMQQFSDLNFQGSQIAPAKLDENNRLETLNIRFNDINSKLTYKISEKHKASLSLIHIGNDFDYLFRSISREGTATQTSDLDNWGMTAKWAGQLTQKLGSTVSLTTSTLKINEQNHETEGIDILKSNNIDHRLDDRRLLTDFNYKINETIDIRIGYEWRDQHIQSEETREVGPPPPPSRDNSAQTHTAFSDLKLNFGNKLITNLGLHTDYYAPLSEWYADPRLSLSYLATNSLALKASGGRSHQFIKQDYSTDFEDFLLANQFWRLSTENSPPLEGYQAMVGASWDKQNWIIDLEIYGKKTHNVTQRRDRATGIIPMGSLITNGADLFLKKRWNRFEAWTGYSISKTTSDFGEEDIAFFDQTHGVDLMFIVNMNRWDWALSWNYMTGMPVVIPDLSPENNPNPNAPTALDVPYSGRFPDFHQLDLSLTYQLWPVGHKLKGVAGLSFLNIYDRQNFINIFQKDVDAAHPYRYAIGFSPNLQLSISF